MVSHGTSATAVLDAVAARGGWWSALSRGDLLSLYTRADDTYYRAHHEYLTRGLSGAPFDQIRPAYLIGHIAGFNPEIAGRSWDQVEPLLAGAWLGVSETPWQEVEVFAEAGFKRAAGARDDAWRLRLAESDSAWNAA